jgi:hypothetical protein
MSPLIVVSKKINFAVTNINRRYFVEAFSQAVLILHKTKNNSIFFQPKAKASKIFIPRNLTRFGKFTS